jgi:hypothetical protein
MPDDEDFHRLTGEWARLALILDACATEMTKQIERAHVVQAQLDNARRTLVRLVSDLPETKR